MSGTASTSVVGVGGAELGYGGNGAPFTAVQWQELEQQAMIYKYLVAGVPVPPDLVMAIRHSFQALPAGFFHRPSLGYSCYGKKFDPEPGRCRRTDGKKWRCSKEAHSDSKYCERHMHRGRNRSRKHVESQSTSQSLPTAIPHIFTGCSTNSRNLHGSSGSGSSQRTPLYTVDDSEGSSFGRNATKLQTEPISYGIDEKKFRYKQGLTPGADEHTLSREASESVGNIGSSAASSTRHPMPAQVSLSSSFEQDSDFQIMGNPSAQQHMPYAFQPIDEQKQCCFYVRDVGLPGPVKQEQHPMHLFFSEWPTTKESWSNLDDDGSNQNVLSSTQLSISIPKASSDFPSRSAYTTNEA